jgi:hypothetical protein
MDSRFKTCLSQKARSDLKYKTKRAGGVAQATFLASSKPWVQTPVLQKKKKKQKKGLEHSSQVALGYVSAFSNPD